MLQKPQILAFYTSIIIFTHIAGLMIVYYFQIKHQIIQVLAELLTIPFIIIDVLIGLYVIREILLNKHTQIQLFTLLFFTATMALITAGTVFLA